MGKKEKAEARAKRRKKKMIKKIAVWTLVLAGAVALIFFLVKSGAESGVGNSSVEPVNA